MTNRNMLMALFAGIFIAAIAGLAFLLVIDDDDDGSALEEGRYENNGLRYLFEFPTEWSDARDQMTPNLPEGADLLDYVAVGQFDESAGLLEGVQVSVVRIKESVDRADLESQLLEVDTIFKQLAAQARGRLNEPTWVELGGLQARQYVLEYVNGPVLAAMAQTVTFFGDRQYSVACTGRLDTFDDKVLAGCEQALQSFRFE